MFWDLLAEKNNLQLQIRCGEDYSLATCMGPLKEVIYSSICD